MFRGLAIFNTVGVVLLAALAVVQWSVNRAGHEQFMEEHRQRTALEKELNEARQRAAGLEGDVERLKAGLSDAQKAAEEASGARLPLETQVKSLTAERDQHKQQLTTWEAAIKDRNARIAQLSAQLRETRERLDEAVKRLEGKKG